MHLDPKYRAIKLAIPAPGLLAQILLVDKHVDHLIRLLR
jgi:hypothetical protein